jgi:hypothetical protein
MNVLSLHVFAAMLAATAIGVMPKPSYAQAVELVVVDVKAVARGYRASKLRGTNVTSEKNEKVGEIDDIIVGRDRALFAVLQVGGLLGVGGHLIAVPFHSLQIDETGRKIVLPGASRDAVRKLPEFKHAPDSSVGATK